MSKAGTAFYTTDDNTQVQVFLPKEVKADLQLLAALRGKPAVKFYAWILQQYAEEHHGLLERVRAEVAAAGQEPEEGKAEHVANTGKRTDRNQY